MKTCLTTILTVFPFIFNLHAQVPPIASQITYIPDTLEVPTFTPPAPPVPRILPAIRIDATTTARTGNGKNLTLQRGAPSTEPDLPLPPPPAPPTVSRASTPEEIAQNNWHQRHQINIGATIFDYQISLIHWKDPISLVSYEAVCGFDVGLLAGLGGFVCRGEEFSLFLMHSNYNTADSHEASHAEISKTTTGQIRIIQGNPQDPHALTLLQILREVIDAEKPRLITYQAARKQYYEAANAWHTAHPPVPKDEIFILRPHRGSRYLKNPETKGTSR